MSLLDLIIEIVVYVCGWRVLLCFGAGGAVACVLAGFSVYLVYPCDLPVAAAVLGFAMGVYWEVEAHERVL